MIVATKITVNTDETKITFSDGKETQSFPLVKEAAQKIREFRSLTSTYDCKISKKAQHWLRIMASI